MSDTIFSILHIKANPSTKLGLIALCLNDDPMTVRELNSRLNCLKTYQNYLDLFKDQIADGIVYIIDMKDKYGTTRHHFGIDITKIIED